MAKKSMIAREVKRAALVAKYATKRSEIKAIIFGPEEVTSEEVVDDADNSSATAEPSAAEE